MTTLLQLGVSHHWLEYSHVKTFKTTATDAFAATPPTFEL